MKRIGRALVVVAMMVGAIGAAGCNKASDQPTQQDSAPAPVAQETPVAATPKANAPVAKDESTTVKASVSVGVDAQHPRYAPVAPPAPRFEYIGRPPSERHLWIKGHWRWTGRDWIWIGGRWEVRRVGFVHEGAHWELQHGRYHFVPGHWVRR